MTTEQSRIADKVRGIAAEHRQSQQNIADTLRLSRTSVVERYAGRVPFTATELLTLSKELGEPIARFFPEAAA